MTPEDLVEIELIKRLKYRYLRSIDQKLWDDCSSPASSPRPPPATAAGSTSSRTGPTSWRSAASRWAPPPSCRSHRCHHPEIDLVGADEATGTWALEDTVILTDFS